MSHCYLSVAVRFFLSILVANSFYLSTYLFANTYSYFSTGRKVIFYWPVTKSYISLRVRTQSALQADLASTGGLIPAGFFGRVRVRFPRISVQRIPLTLKAGTASELCGGQ
jgi:hypothetical protein